MRHHRVRGLQRHTPTAGQGQHDADQHVAHARPSQERFQGHQHHKTMTKHKGIILKEKGKKPIVFNSLKYLADYWNVSRANVSLVLKTIAYYKTIVDKYNIESIGETYDVNIPDEYIEKGFKPIGEQLVLNRFGVVINVITGKVVTQRKDSLGFMSVRLSDGRKYRYIHRLVAELFIPNPLHYPNIRHINGDRTDNRAENLEWVPYKREPKENYHIKIPQSYIDQGYRAVNNKGPKVYAVNKEGKIICVTTGQEIIPSTNSASGYAYVTINGHSHTHHRIVAEAFIPNPYNLPMINHKNEIKTDNRAENLEWCTAKYNTNYGDKEKYKIRRQPIKIKAIIDGEEKIFQSIKEAARQTGADTRSIQFCLEKKRKSAKGFLFFRVE